MSETKPETIEELAYVHRAIYNVPTLANSDPYSSESYLRAYGLFRTLMEEHERTNGPARFEETLRQTSSPKFRTLVNTLKRVRRANSDEVDDIDEIVIEAAPDWDEEEDEE